MRPSKDTYYLDIALAVSKRSNCIKRRYGCVIVKDDEIIATGYNGSPRGFENCSDTMKCDRLYTAHNTGDYSDCNSVHAEQNAMLSAKRSDMIGATMYLSCEEFVHDEEKAAYWEDDWQEVKDCIPCHICKRMIINSGIEKVINRMGEIYVRN